MALKVAMKLQESNSTGLNSWSIFWVDADEMGKHSYGRGK